MGYREYEPLARRYRIPIVVTGFEPLDLLQGIYMTVDALERGAPASRTSTSARSRARATRPPSSSS